MSELIAALKAATTIGTEQGAFTAVISTGAVDRQQDIVDPDRMVAALQKWVQVEKMIPLDWNHGEGATDQIGHVDPATAKNVNGEVVVDGWVDQSTENGEHAWRLVKSGTLGFSFYGLIPRDSVAKRKGGGVHIQGDFDVAAVTATPTPVNNQTRVLAWKALEPAELPEAVVEALEELKDDLSDEAKVDLIRKAQEVLGVQHPQQTDATDKEPEQARSVDPLRKRSEELALEVVSDGMSLRKTPPTTKVEPKPEPMDLRELKRRSHDLMLWQLSGMETDV